MKLSKRNSPPPPLHPRSQAKVAKVILVSSVGATRVHPQRGTNLTPTFHTAFLRVVSTLIVWAERPLGAGIALGALLKCTIRFSFVPKESKPLTLCTINQCNNSWYLGVTLHIQTKFISTHPSTISLPPIYIILPQRTAANTRLLSQVLGLDNTNLTIPPVQSAVSTASG